jgi:hypothetical protein
VDLQILFIISLVRLVQGGTVDISEDAMIFNSSGKIFQAAAGSLSAATDEQASLVQASLELKRSCNKRKSKNHVESLLLKLNAEFAEKALAHTWCAVHNLRALRDAGERLPSEGESVRAAAVITHRLYEEARHELGSNADRLDDSYAHFEAYLDNPAETLKLGLALVALRMALKDKHLTDGKMAPARLMNALKTIIMLVALRCAGSHSDRDMFEHEVHRILSASLLEWALGMSEDAKKIELLRLSSCIFQCFKKTLGDVPEAFWSKNKNPRRDSGKIRVWKKKAKPEDSRRPEKEHESEQLAVAADKVESEQEHDSEHLATAADKVETEREHEAELSTAVELYGNEGHDGGAVLSPISLSIDISISKLNIVENKKMQRYEVEEPEPPEKQKLCQTEPPKRWCHGSSSVGGDAGDLPTLPEEPIGTEQRHYCVISELNFMLVWRDYNNVLTRDDGHEYAFFNGKMYIRPGADTFVAKLLDEPTFSFVLMSCSGWHHSSNMARLLLERASPGPWEVKDSNGTEHLPYLVNPKGQKVFLAYGDFVNSVPKDFQESARDVKPGDLGAEIDPTTGSVSAITSDGQLASLGAKVGWRMLKLNGVEYSHDLLNTLESGSENYTVTFQGKIGIVKDMERVFEGLRASRCGYTVDVDTTVVLDSTRGTNTHTDNVLELPVWTARIESEDGIFEPLLDYLFELSKSTSSVPQYIHDHPRGAVAGDGEAELMRKHAEAESWTGWVRTQTNIAPSVVEAECCPEARDTGDEMKEGKEQDHDGREASHTVKLLSVVYGEYWNPECGKYRWCECEVQELKDDGSVRVKWVYDGSETDLTARQVRNKW